MLSVLKKTSGARSCRPGKIIDPDAEAKQKKAQEEAAKQPIDWIKVLLVALIVVASTALIVFNAVAYLAVLQCKGKETAVILNQKPSAATGQ